MKNVDVSIGAVPEECEQCGKTTADKYRVIKSGTTKWVWVCEGCKMAYDIIVKAGSLYRFNILDKEE